MILARKCTDSLKEHTKKQKQQKRLQNVDYYIVNCPLKNKHEGRLSYNLPLQYEIVTSCIAFIKGKINEDFALTIEYENNS